MYTLLKPLNIRQILLEKNIKIFSFNDFQQIFSLNYARSKRFLEKQTIDGLLLRLKRDLYCLNTDLPSIEEISNNLYKPSYISFEYALSYYGIIPEAVYTITNATTKATRNFIVQNQEYSYSSIKKSLYFGYVLVTEKNRQFLIAEPEKALLDYYYFVYLKMKEDNERISSKDLDRNKLLKYADRYNLKGFINFIKSKI
jgi:predicted transcriptional regulator of viral defense system